MSCSSGKCGNAISYSGMSMNTNSNNYSVANTEPTPKPDSTANKNNSNIDWQHNPNNPNSGGHFGDAKITNKKYSFSPVGIM